MRLVALSSLVVLFPFLACSGGFGGPVNQGSSDDAAATSDDAAGGYDAIAGDSGTSDAPDDALADSPSTSGPVPLIDMGSAKYEGFSGLLYDGSNDPPAAHITAGLARANAIRPLDTNGNPSASGKYVLLSIGMSNTTMEYCGINPCPANSFGALPEPARGLRVEPHLRGRDAAGVLQDVAFHAVLVRIRWAAVQLRAIDRRR